MSVRDMVRDKLTDKSERELVDYVGKCFNTARTARIPFERQWYLNLSFYFGRQYAQWVTSALDATTATDASYSKLYEPPTPPWRVKFISNKIKPIIRGELAKVTKEKPRGFIFPNTMDEADLAGARAGESIHASLWRELGMNRVIRRAQFWNLLCGSSFVKDWYEKNKIDPYGVRGSICAEHATPFHILAPDLQQEELEYQPFLIHVMAKDPEWVEKNFGVKVQPDSGQQGGGILEQRFLSALGVNQVSNSKTLVSVKEAWIKPNGKFPDGKYILVANQKILFERDGFPYQYRKGEPEYPYTKFDHIPTGRFYGDSTIVDLMSPQKEYNRTRSQIMEAKNRMSKPQLLAVKGSVDPNRITSEPGLIIFYTPGFAPPTPLQLQNLPSYVIDEVERIQRDMDDISSQHEITKGSVPPGVTAATAISFLQEQDDSKLHTTISSLEEGVEKIGRHFLSHVVQFWTVERMVQLTGVNGGFEAKKFKSQSLNSNTNYAVEAGSATPTSRAAKQAFIMELMKDGYIPPNQGLKYLNMSETGRMYEELQRNARHAQRENMDMLAGKEVPINTFDEDLAHVVEHEDFCKTEEYETSDDQIKANIQEHLTQHRQKLAMMQGLMLPPDDIRLIAIGRGLPAGPPPSAQIPGQVPNGGQPQLNGAPPEGGSPQGAQNALPVPSPAPVSP